MNTTADGRRRPRPAPRHTTERLLDIAVALAGTHSSRHFAVSHVTIAAVAASAAVSRGAVYRLWASQQDYWNDLIEFLERGPATAGPAPASGGNAATTATTTEGETAIADAAQQLLLVEHSTLLRTATAHSTLVRAGGPTADRYRAVRLAELAATLDATVLAAGRRYVVGVAAIDVAAAVTALGCGLPITGRMCAPDDLHFDAVAGARPGAPRSLLGVATAAIRDHLTTAEPGPAPPAGPASWVGAAAPIAATPSESRVNGRRRFYLELGARLAQSREGTAEHRVLGHVTLDNVARAAGISRRTISSIWPDQAQFRRDLFAHLLRIDRADVAASLRTATIVHQTGRPATDALRTVGDEMQRRLASRLDRPTFRAFATQLDAPAFASRAIAEHRHLVDACTADLRRFLTAIDRQLRHGVSARQLLTVLFTLNDGFATLQRTCPTALRDDIELGGEQPNTTFGASVGAVLEALTEPRPTSAEVDRYVALIS